MAGEWERDAVPSFSAVSIKKEGGVGLFSGVAFFVGLLFCFFYFGFVSPSVFRLGLHPPSQHTQVQFFLHLLHMQSTHCGFR